MQTTATLDDVLAMDPCYDRAGLLRMSGGRTAMTVLDVCDLPDVEPRDKLWIILRPEFVSPRDLRLLACGYAERALPVYEASYSDDRRVRELLDVSRRYANGAATDDDLDAAIEAIYVRFTAHGAATMAALAVIDTTRWDDRDAAWAAALSAPDAALSSSPDAVWYDMWYHQLSDARKVLSSPDTHTRGGCKYPK